MNSGKLAFFVAFGNPFIAAILMDTSSLLFYIYILALLGYSLSLLIAYNTNKRYINNIKNKKIKFDERKKTIREEINNIQNFKNTLNLLLK